MNLSKMKVSSGKIEGLIDTRQALITYDPEKGILIEAYTGKRAYLYTVWLTPYEARELKERLNRPPWE